LLAHQTRCRKECAECGSMDMPVGSQQASGALTAARGPKVHNSEPGFRFNMRNTIANLVVTPPPGLRRSLGGPSRRPGHQQHQPHNGSSAALPPHSPRTVCGSCSPPHDRSVRLMGSSPSNPRRSLRAMPVGCSTMIAPASRRATLPHSPKQEQRQQQQQHQTHSGLSGSFDHDPPRRFAQPVLQPLSARHSLGRWLARSRSAEQAIGSGSAPLSASCSACEDDNLRQRQYSPPPPHDAAEISSHLPHVRAAESSSHLPHLSSSSSRSRNNPWSS